MVSLTQKPRPRSAKTNSVSATLGIGHARTLFPRSPPFFPEGFQGVVSAQQEDRGGSRGTKIARNRLHCIMARKKPSVIILCLGAPSGTTGSMCSAAERAVAQNHQRHEDPLSQYRPSTAHDATRASGCLGRTELRLCRSLGGLQNCCAKQLAGVPGTRRKVAQRRSALSARAKRTDTKEDFVSTAQSLVTAACPVLSASAAPVRGLDRVH
jgi:hypothetical protein